MLPFILMILLINWMSLTVFDSTPMTVEDRRTAYIALFVGNIGAVIAAQRLAEVLSGH